MSGPRGSSYGVGSKSAEWWRRCARWKTSGYRQWSTPRKSCNYLVEPKLDLYDVSSTTIQDCLCNSWKEDWNTLLAAPLLRWGLPVMVPASGSLWKKKKMTVWLDKEEQDRLHLESWVYRQLVPETEVKLCRQLSVSGQKPKISACGWRVTLGQQSNATGLCPLGGPWDNPTLTSVLE